MRVNGEAPRVLAPARRKAPKSIHLKVAKHVPSDLVGGGEQDGASVFDGSALRDITAAARTGSREQVHRLAHAIKIDQSPCTRNATD